jgi:hypothetical protein
MSEKLERATKKFSMGTTEMLTRADFMYSMYELHKAAFQLVSPEFSTAWQNEFLADKELARDTIEPRSAIAQCMQYTQDVEGKMQQCRQSIQELYFYVDRVYPADADRMAGYGKGSQYEKARKNRLRMENLMQTCADMIAVDQSKLVNKGYTTAKITAFNTLLTTFKAANKALDKQKGLLKRSTNTYYTNLNKVWEKMVRLNSAAALAFMDDIAVRRHFRLYKPRKDEGKVFTLEAESGKAAVHRLQGVLEPTQALEFHIIEGADAAKICFALDSASGPEGEIKEVPLGNKVVFTYEQFESIGRYLRVMSEGKVRVRVKVRKE